MCFQTPSEYSSVFKEGTFQYFETRNYPRWEFKNAWPEREDASPMISGFNSGRGDEHVLSQWMHSSRTSSSFWHLSFRTLPRNVSQPTEEKKKKVESFHMRREPGEKARQRQTWLPSAWLDPMWNSGTWCVHCSSLDLHGFICDSNLTQIKRDHFLFGLQPSTGCVGFVGKRVSCAGGGLIIPTHTSLAAPTKWRWSHWFPFCRLSICSTQQSFQTWREGIDRLIHHLINSFQALQGWLDSSWCAEEEGGGGGERRALLHKSINTF